MKIETRILSIRRPTMTVWVPQVKRFFMWTTLTETKDNYPFPGTREREIIRGKLAQAEQDIENYIRDKKAALQKAPERRKWFFPNTTIVNHKVHQI